MSLEYEQPGERSWCTDYVHRAIELAKGPDSLSMLRGLLSVPGSVVYEAFESLGFEPKELTKSLTERLRKRSEAVASETWIVEKATRRAKQDGFPLATDYILEVIWDEDTAGAAWLTELVDPERLERALNASRYPDPGGASPAAEPEAPSAPTTCADRNMDDIPRSH